ncbi:MAG: sigma-54 interaction domain-containing protein [Muribaculaceae bacterium]
MPESLTRLNASVADENRPSPEVMRAKQRFGIIGNTPALNEAVARALVVAPIDLSVLVIGESGSGKEFFPKIIHENSARKHARYIAINCGAIPEGTIDSELFGHEKGSFTGAVAARKGYFEEADGGTIFLDEVAELPLTTQARLLRVLETGEFLKVGSSQVQRTNVRIVAATNVDLPGAIARGKFREDLFYRLSTVQIDVPPLRDRTADIMLMARRFASTFAENYRTAPVEFDDSARMALQDYSWPGNVRQLKNIVEQIALFNAGGTVTGAIVDSYLPRTTHTATPVRSGSHSYDDEREALFNMIFNLRARIDELEERLQGRPVQQPITSAVDVTDYPTALVPSSVTDQARHIISPGFVPASPAQPTERDRIAEALKRHDGHRKAAAADLGISERTLYRKIREYDLE